MFLLLAGCLIDADLYEERLAALTDHDGDGFAQRDDCDDTDPDVSPSAPETCDGTDQDCDDEVDEDAVGASLWYADGDADGYGDSADAGTSGCVAPAGTVSNALDCDDGSTRVNPGEEEVPYDGTDQDCDGGDLADVDADGFDAVEAGGEDCDDSDANVNPSMSEIPYDGVDQDCLDGDTDDADADGSIAVEAGGGDCDDSDPTIHPSADETWADGFTDNDCDGEQESVSLEIGRDVWAGTVEGDNQGRRIAALGDLDGDGLQDILVGSDYDSTVGPNSGAVYAIDGAPTGNIEAGRALLPSVDGLYFASDVDAGEDLTDDGVPDILVSTAGSDAVAGTAWLVDGARWAAGGDTIVDDVVYGEVTGSAPGTYGPTSVRIVGDLTGDGVTDIALSECCGTASGSSTRGRVAIFSVDAFNGTIEDADVLIDGPWDGAYLGGEMDPVGDQDGDGLGEIVVSGTGDLAAAVVGGDESGPLEDLAVAIIYGGSFTGFPDARDAGDLDGDGLRDMAVLNADVDGFVYIFTTLAASPTLVLQDPYAVVEWSEHGGVADVVPLADRDEDGRDELFLPQFYSDSGTQRVWVLQGADVSYGARLDAESSLLTGVSVVPGARFGYAAALVGDADGDGQDDIAIGAPTFSGAASDAGAATLIPAPR